MKEHKNATPFPHTVVDGILGEEVIDAILKEWPSDGHFYYKECDTSIKYSLGKTVKIPPTILSILNHFNSPEFVQELRNLTGIEDLIPDPQYLKGGGLHMIPRGGHLQMHADFNWHEPIKKVRKVNLLVYLNKDWKEEWGGALELLGPPDKMNEIKIITPKAGRAVIFNTTSDSWHGHPYPLTCPEGVTRRSLALYYYSENEPKPEKTHSTIYIPIEEYENRKSAEDTVVEHIR